MNATSQGQPSLLESTFPLSFAQERMWFLYRLDPADPSYHLTMALRCTGPLDQEALLWALREVVRRHDVLRTVFGEHDGVTCQKINEAFVLDLELVHLRQAELPDFLAREARKPFDLERSPGIRATLIRLNDRNHVLQITLHHIISDGWSLGIMVRDTASFYEAFKRGLLNSLPPLKMQYRHFALEQRTAVRESEMEIHLQYWRKHLAGEPLMYLPADRIPPVVSRHAGSKLPIQLRADLFTKLQDIGRQEGLTLFMVLLTSLLLVLRRWMRQEDLAVGTAAANRERTELEQLIGFFINTLALRVNLGGNPTISQLLQRVRLACLGAYAHQDVPFDKLVLELNPDRNLNRSPLFQVMLALQNAPAPDFHLAGLRLEPLTFDLGISQFDMALSVWDVRGRMEGWLEYSTELFEMQTMQRFLEHWQRALEEMVVDASKEISSVHLLSFKEQRQILEEWNTTAQENQLDRYVHDLFEQNAQRTPKAVAVTHGEDELTYRELNERSNQLAHYLIRLNLGPEKLVGIFLPRSTEMIVAMVGTLKAGAAYIPLDPDYPPDRLRFMLDDARASRVLTHTALADRLGWRRELTVSLDNHREAIAKESPANPRTKLSPLNLAYVIYTSGSTGQPKGVQISHASLLNLVRWHLQAFDMSSSDVASQMASLGFDAAVWEIWPCLVAGAKLCLVDDHVRLSPTDLRDLILARNITISFMPTPVAENVLAVEWPEKTSLKTLLAGGDRLHRCVSRPLPFLLINNYGPTECTVIASSMTVDSGKEMDPPIGYPIRNTKIYVLDDEMELSPARIAGELYIGGAGLARSYVSHPEMTAEKFVPDPFSQEPGGRLYRTGDLARWRLDGSLEFLGRADEQVKIRGFRIELGEIEIALREIPGVRDAVVTVLEEHARQQQLVAYITGSVTSIAEFRRHLQRRLPAYMIPAAFVPMESLPLTPNGKVDRRSLPKPHATDRHEQEYVAPRTATQQLICGIFTQVLGVEQIGLHDSFFHLGGHSLLASKVILRLEEVFQIKLPLRVLFEAANAEDLALAVEEALLAEIEAIPEPVAAPFAGSKKLN